MSVENQNEICGPVTEAQQQLNNFWPKSKEEILNLSANDVRQQELPLARIKRIMKLDDDVKMISAEAPALFSKAAEIFITELTLRAWVHTEDNKRRTLQKNDIAMAITKYDQFDFLIDIVPRDEIKPAKTRDDGRVGVSTDQHYFQIAQHYQTVLQQSSASNNTQSSSATNGTPQTIQIITTGGQVQTVQAQQATLANQVTNPAQAPQPPIIQLQAPAPQPTPTSPQQQQQQQQQSATQAQGGGIQIIQQIMGPDGQIQQIPIQLTQQQLQMIRLQMSGATQQPIIIQAAPIPSVNQSTQASGTSPPQIIQLQQV